MDVKDPKETFPVFYARFTAEIAPLNLSDSVKRGHLKRLITWRLRSRIMDGTVVINFPALVARLRQLDTELRINDDSREAAPKRGGASKGSRGGSSSGRGGSASGRGGSSTSSFRGVSRGNQSTGSSGGGRYRLPKNQAQMLKKQGRCYKCLEYGHRHYDENAPCLSAKWSIKEDVATKLIAFGIEVSEADNPAELGLEN